MTAQNEGYKIMPPMDPKYTERSGLEGPFTTLSGKVVYYDPKEGSYYDPDTDMYMSYDEFRRYDDDYTCLGQGHVGHRWQCGALAVGRRHARRSSASVS